MTSFKYDVVTLIELVESKPCLWDKTSENNKNKILRDKSWQEIFQYLEDGYEQLSQAEKKKTGKYYYYSFIQQKVKFSISARVIVHLY